MQGMNSKEFGIKFTNKKIYNDIILINRLKHKNSFKAFNMHTFNKSSMNKNIIFYR